MITQHSYNDVKYSVNHTMYIPFYIVWWMNFFQYHALSTPWNTIYYKDVKAFQNKRLRKHELMHMEQMHREHKLIFLLKYNFFWLTIGYTDNPYEIEAREVETR